MLIQREGRILSILGVCSFLAARFYYCYLTFYYVWAEQRLIVLLSKIMGGGCDAMKTMTLVDPQLTRQRLENTIRSVYSQRKAHKIAKQWPAVCASAEPPYPHAVVAPAGREGKHGSYRSVLKLLCIDGSSINPEYGETQFAL